MSESHTTAGSSPIVLREYRRSDLDGMFHLDEICFEEPFRFSKAAMRRFAEARHAEVLIASMGEQLAGFVIVHRERAGEELFGYVLTIDIAPAFRRRSLAQRLLRRAEENAQGAGCTAMLLHVFPGNDAAKALYGKLGYVRSDVAEHFYGKGLHAWVYRKPFQGNVEAAGLE